MKKSIFLLLALSIINTTESYAQPGIRGNFNTTPITPEGKKPEASSIKPQETPQAFTLNTKTNDGQNKKYITPQPSLWQQIKTPRPKEHDMLMTIPTPFSQDIQINLSQIVNFGMALLFNASAGGYISQKDDKKNCKNQPTNIILVSALCIGISNTYKYLMGQMIPFSWVDKPEEKNEHIDGNKNTANQ